GAIMIQDNASYHKDIDVWNWFKSNRHWLEGHQLPPYSPELNPTERLWQHTRKTGTHNRFFACKDALVATLTRVFEEMQSHPQLISSYVPLIIRDCIAAGAVTIDGASPVGNCHQRIFRPNWISRGDILSLVIFPKLELLKLLFGLPNTVWFGVLNDSARNCTV